MVWEMGEGGGWQEEEGEKGKGVGRGREGRKKEGERGKQKIGWLQVQSKGTQRKEGMLLCKQQNSFVITN